jgi:hypothetical protein
MWAVVWFYVWWNIQTSDVVLSATAPQHAEDGVGIIAMVRSDDQLDVAVKVIDYMVIDETEDDEDLYPLVMRAIHICSTWDKGILYCPDPTLYKKILAMNLCCDAQ